MLVKLRKLEVGYEKPEESTLKTEQMVLFKSLNKLFHVIICVC